MGFFLSADQNLKIGVRVHFDKLIQSYAMFKGQEMY